MEKYFLKKEIGKGSFGTVFKATKKNNCESFAIKQVHCDAPENVELALQEFWTLSCLQKHLNIIRFEECFLQHGDNIRLMKHGDLTSSSYLHLVEMSIKGECGVAVRGGYHLWFVMEYCDEGDMNDYVLSRVPIPALNASFMLQLADGISFLHQNNVVHRDLKPENILVQSNNAQKKKNTQSFPILKIADFGLSKVCLANESSSRMNVNDCWLSSACGSDFFMAPEVFEERYTAKADVFALGIMFWAIMDRITFIDAGTKKVLLGTYVRQDKKVLSVGEALLDDPKLDILQLLHETSLRRPVSVRKKDETVVRLRKKPANHSCTCVAGDAEKLRSLIALMVHVNADLRPNSDELLRKLKSVLTSSAKYGHATRLGVLGTLTCGCYYRIKSGSKARKTLDKCKKNLPASQSSGDSANGITSVKQEDVADMKTSPPKIVRPPSLAVAIIRSKHRSMARRHVHRIVDEDGIMNAATKPDQLNLRRSARLAPGREPQSNGEVNNDSNASNVEAKTDVEQSDEPDSMKSNLADANDPVSVSNDNVSKFGEETLLKVKANSSEKLTQPTQQPPSICRLQKIKTPKKPRPLRRLRSSITERRKSLRSYNICEVLHDSFPNVRRKIRRTAPASVKDSSNTSSQGDAKDLSEEVKLVEEKPASDKHSDVATLSEKKSKHKCYPKSVKKRWIDYAASSSEHSEKDEADNPQPLSTHQLAETNTPSQRSDNACSSISPAAVSAAGNSPTTSAIQTTSQTQLFTRCTTQINQSKMVLPMHRQLSLKQQINQVAKIPVVARPSYRVTHSKIVRQPAKIRMKAEQHSLPCSSGMHNYKQRERVSANASTSQQPMPSNSTSSHFPRSQATTHESYTVTMQSPISYCDNTTIGKQTLPSRSHQLSIKHLTDNSLSSCFVPRTPPAVNMPLANAHKRKIVETDFSNHLSRQSSKKMKLDNFVSGESSIPLPPYKGTMQKTSQSTAAFPTGFPSSSGFNHFLLTSRAAAAELPLPGMVHPQTSPPMRRLSYSSPELLLPSNHVGLQRPGLSGVSLHPLSGSPQNLSRTLPPPYKNSSHIMRSILPPISPHLLPPSFARPDVESDSYLRRTLSLDMSPPGTFPFQHPLSRTPPSNLIARP